MTASLLLGCIALVVTVPAILLLARVLQLSKMRPARPETPRLLPAVAAAWPSVMAALRDARTAVVEQALQLLQHMLNTAGEDQRRTP